MRILLPLLLAFAVPANAQTIVLSGGASSLFGGEGGQASLFLPQSTMSAGIGYSQHHIVAGAFDKFAVGGLDVTAGSQMRSYSFDGAGLGFSLTGLAAQKKTDTSSLEVFAGGIGLGFSTPYLLTTTPSHIGLGFSGQKQFHNLTLSTLNVLDGGKLTLAQGISYQYHRTFKLSGSAGLLNNQKYYNGTASVQATRWASLYASHNNYLADARSTQTQKAISDGLGASINVGRFSGTAGLNQSTSGIGKVRGENAGIGARINFVQLNSSVYKSGNNRVLLVHSITENVRRWTLSQAINESVGHNSYSFSGGYHGNRFSVSLNQSVQFVIDRGYERVTGISISFRLHDSSFTVQTVADAFGKTEYSAYSETYIQTGIATAGHETQAESGKYILRGVVRDSEGKPVSGACLHIGKQIVYTNDSGEWQLRTRSNKAVPVAVMLSEFSVGDWKIVAAPQAGQPGTEIVVVVKRL